MTTAQPRKTVYFHVGLPKTGTSTVQAMLRENAGRLQDAGLHVMFNDQMLRAVNRQAGRICKYGASDHAARLRLALATRRLSAALRAVPEQRILVSDENLPGWRIDNLYRLPFDRGPRLVMEALRAAFDDFDIRWIMATRDATDHMRSAHVFVTQQKGETADFDSWSARIGKPEEIDRLIADTAAYWGAAGHVFRMEDEIAAGRPWGHNILAHVGVPQAELAQLIDVKPANSGVPKNLLPFVRRVNALNLEDETRKQVVQVLRDLHDDLAAPTEDSKTDRRSASRGKRS